MLNGLKWLYSKIQTALREDLITVYASQASFYMIIAVLPFAILLLSVMKFVLPLDAAGLLTIIKGFLPQNMYRLAEIAILELFERSGGIISISAVTSLWVSSRGVAAVSRGVRRVYNIKGRSFLLSLLQDAFNTVLLMLILLLTLAVLVFGSLAAEILAGRLIISNVALGFFEGFRVIIFFAVLTLIFAFLYRIISGGEIPFKYHLSGAVFSALGWILFSLGYEFYIENFSSYSYIYGSLTAVVLLMLWLYFCMIIFLFGAEINIFVYNERKKENEKDWLYRQR